MQREYEELVDRFAGRFCEDVDDVYDGSGIGEPIEQRRRWYPFDLRARKVTQKAYHSAPIFVRVNGINSGHNALPSCPLSRIGFIAFSKPFVCCDFSGKLSNFRNASLPKFI